MERTSFNSNQEGCDIPQEIYFAQSNKPQTGISNNPTVPL